MIYLTESKEIFGATCFYNLAHVDAWRTGIRDAMVGLNTGAQAVPEQAPAAVDMDDFNAITNLLNPADLAVWNAAPQALRGKVKHTMAQDQWKELRNSVRKA